MQNTLTAEAAKAYNDSKYPEAIELYGRLITTNPEVAGHYLNRASVYNTIDNYEKCIEDCHRALELNCNQPNLYIMMANCLRKSKQPVECKNILKQSLIKNPDNKKLQNMLKQVLQVESVSTQQGYIQLMFAKFCDHPKLRTYLQDESFLTKLEMLVRNPQIVNQLAKVDKRILQAYDVMMLSEQDS